jgi:hypothetical protein
MAVALPSSHRLAPPGSTNHLPQLPNDPIELRAADTLPSVIGPTNLNMLRRSDMGSRRRTVEFFPGASGQIPFQLDAGVSGLQQDRPLRIWLILH